MHEAEEGGHYRHEPLADLVLPEVVVNGLHRVVLQVVIRRQEPMGGTSMVVVDPEEPARARTPRVARRSRAGRHGTGPPRWPPPRTWRSSSDRRRCLRRWRARHRRHCTGAIPPAIRSHPAPDRPWAPPRGRRPRPGSGPGPGGGGKVLRISPSAGGNLLGNHSCPQGGEGTWKSSIGDPTHPIQPERSGSGVNLGPRRHSHQVRLAHGEGDHRTWRRTPRRSRAYRGCDGDRVRVHHLAGGV